MNRYHNRKSGSTLRRVFDTKPQAVFLCDRVDKGKSQTSARYGAAVFRGEKWFEQAVLDLRRDTRTGIDDGQFEKLLCRLRAEHVRPGGQRRECLQSNY